MLKFIKTFFLITTFLFFSNIAMSQLAEPSKIDRFKVGFLIGYGNQSMLNVVYEYHVVFLQNQLYYSIFEKSGWSIEAIIQPQLNLTRFRYIDSSNLKYNGFEFGLNAGFIVRKSLFKDNMSIYMLLSVGPHYVSGVPKRQCSGFIFSDNFFIGITIKLNEKIDLDLRPGFRHISNAGISKPNKGINNLIISGGLLFRINR